MTDFEIEDEKRLIRLLSRKEITIYINIAQTYIMQKQYEQGLSLYQKLKDYSDKTGIPLSKLFDKAIAMYLESVDK